MKESGCQQAGQRGAEQNAGEDLAHRRRLAGTPRRHITEASGGDNHGQLRRDEKQQRFGLMDRERAECGRQIMPPLTEITWPVM